jgi:hypothetical protein
MDPNISSLFLCVEWRQANVFLMRAPFFIPCLHLLSRSLIFRAKNLIAPPTNTLFKAYAYYLWCAPIHICMYVLYAIRFCSACFSPFFHSQTTHRQRNKPDRFVILYHTLSENQALEEALIVFCGHGFSLEKR